MRFLLAIAVLTFVGCTVTIDPHESEAPSEFLSQFSLAELVTTLPGGDVRAPGSSAGGGEGMTKHRGNRYFKKQYSLRLEMSVEKQAEFLAALQIAFKDEINATDVRVQGESKSINVDDGALDEFGFEYVSDKVFGWVDVGTTSYADQLVLTMQIHEAEI